MFLLRSIRPGRSWPRFALLIAMLVVVTAVGVSFAPRASAQSSTWIANYWNTRDFSGPVVAQRFEAWPNHNWGAGSPIPGIVNNDDFSAQWTSAQNFAPGYYRFTVTADDGVRLWVNNFLLIDEWRESPPTTHTAELNLPQGGQIPIQVDFFEGKGNAQINVNWSLLSSANTAAPIQAQYWNNTSLTGTPVLTRTEQEVNFNWGNGSPAPGIVNTDNFSARWTRNMNLQPGDYEFTVRADDGVRFWVNNQLVIDEWRPATGLTYRAVVSLPGGLTTFRAEYYEQIGVAYITINGARILPGGGTGGSGGSQTAVIDTSFLNVRSGPGVQFAVLTVARGGTTVTLTGFRDASGQWVQIRMPDGLVGWVNRNYIETSAAIEQFPILTN